MALTARFVRSALAISDCPRSDRVEAAFAGRSNVGKSSLLNAVTGIKGLARTSKTPGRTRSINFFDTAGRLTLVDLPGFGYAKIGRADAANITRLLFDYLARRENLAALVILVDGRRGPQEEEIALAQAVRGRRLEVVVVATKWDKLRNSQRGPALQSFVPIGLEPIPCSILSGEGIEALRHRLIDLAQQYPAPTRDAD